MPPRRIKPQPSDREKQKQEATLRKMRQKLHALSGKRDELLLILAVDLFERRPEMLQRLLEMNLD